jgi:hypothetical protein
MLPAWSVDELRPEDQPIDIGAPGQPFYLYRDPGKWPAQKDVVGLGHAASRSRAER